MTEAPPALTSDDLRSLMPFAATLGIELVSADRDAAVCRMPWDRRLTTVADGFHGGALMGLADSVGAVVAFLNLPEGATTSTVSSSTVFLRGASGGVVTATGRLLHRGRRTIVVETALTDDAGRDLARTTQTQAVLAPAG
jgi:uncharacterized protein (TIGR00369 family)